MAWKIDNSIPIYLQLMDYIQQDIASGVYKAGDKLPPVRELALIASVNPNTMQKALAELERLALVYSKRTSGRYITDDEVLLADMKKRLASDHVKTFVERMETLGFSRDEMKQLISDYNKDFGGIDDGTNSGMSKIDEEI